MAKNDTRNSIPNTGTGIGIKTAPHAEVGKGKKSEKRTKQQLEELRKKGASSVDLSSLTPEQLSQLQLEEAIKESSNPSANLKKLNSPLSIKGCLLNLFFFVVLTFAVVMLICYIKIDNFHFGTVLKDILTKYGIWQVFEKMFKTIGDWFK